MSAFTADAVHLLLHIPPGGCARVIPKEYHNGLSKRYDSAHRRLRPDAPSTALSTNSDHCVTSPEMIDREPHYECFIS